MVRGRSGIQIIRPSVKCSADGFALADQLFDAAFDFVADGLDVVNILARRINELPVFVAFAGIVITVLNVHKPRGLTPYRQHKQTKEPKGSTASASPSLAAACLVMARPGRSAEGRSRRPYRRSARYPSSSRNSTGSGGLVDSFQHPDARSIRPGWTGGPFDLHVCVQALFTIKLPVSLLQQDRQAA